MGSSFRRPQSSLEDPRSAMDWGRRERPASAVPRLAAWLLGLIVVALLAVGMYLLYR
jgi:hypothetical protein